MSDEIAQKGTPSVPELFICNACRNRFVAIEASICPRGECQSQNIELANTRDGFEPLVFKAGNRVVFIGLKHKGKTFPPIQGILRDNIKGVPPECVTIKEDSLQLIFNSDGTLYCHAWLGVLLRHQYDASPKDKDPTDQDRYALLPHMYDHMPSEEKPSSKVLDVEKLDGSMHRVPVQIAAKKSTSHLKPPKAPKSKNPVEQIMNASSLSEVGRLAVLFGQDPKKMRQLWRERRLNKGEEIK